MTHGFPMAMPGQRIGLFGGSFDPAHEGHLRLTRTALQRFRLDRVWWLVTPGNPLKAHGPAPLDQRLAQAREVLRGDPRVVVTDLEARLATRLTADTIAALVGLYPRVRFVWLMGSDNLVQFSQWERWQEIAQMVPIGVMARPGSRVAARFSKAATTMADRRLPEGQAGRLAEMTPPAWVMVNMPMTDASSSAIRAMRQKSGDGRG